MIYRSKGQYKWKKDSIYCVESSLGPLILSYLIQLRDQLNSSDSYGLPRYYHVLQAERQGIPVESIWSGASEFSLDLDAAHEQRMKDLNEIIWAFDPTTEPDIEDYDFTYRNENGKWEFPVKCTNPDEAARYSKDYDDWYNRRQKAFALFGQIYSTLEC